MRSYVVFPLLCWLQFSVHRCPFASAVDFVKPENPVEPVVPLDPEPADPINGSPNDGAITPGDDPLLPGLPGDSSGEPFAGIDNSPKANVPGALFEGKDPVPSEGDEEIDILEIGEKLHDLVDAIDTLFGRPITSAAAAQTTTNADTSFPSMTVADLDPPITSPVYTQPPMPSGAQDCQSARDAYVNCSSPYSGANFATSNRTIQAGCLCNISPDIDFNAYVGGCYSWAEAQNGKSNATVYHKYAMAIANATTLCAPCPSSQGCGPTTAAPTAPTIIQTPTGEAVRSKTGVGVSVCWLLMAALWAAVF